MKNEFKPESFSWEGIAPSGYRAGRLETDGPGYRGVTRHVITGEHGEPAAFHVRYYDVAPGGYTRLERHRHIHSVTVVRGRGYAVVGDRTHAVRPFDNVYVAPMTFHQFVNDGAEPFGFLCVVDAQRDRPEPASPADVAALERMQALVGKLRI